MATRFAFVATLIITMCSAFNAAPARADELNAYIVPTCDAAHNRAMLRFGYGDNNNEPVFKAIPGTDSDDLSQWPVPKDIAANVAPSAPQEASCDLNNGDKESALDNLRKANDLDPVALKEILQYAMTIQKNIKV